MKISDCIDSVFILGLLRFTLIAGGNSVRFIMWARLHHPEEYRCLGRNVESTNYPQKSNVKKKSPAKMCLANKKQTNKQQNKSKQRKKRLKAFCSLLSSHHEARGGLYISQSARDILFTQVVPASYNPGEEADVYVLFVAFCCCCSVLRVHLGSSVSHRTWEEAVACVLLLCSVVLAVVRC